MDAYVYNAALYCYDCGEKIKKEIEQELSEKGKAQFDVDNESSYDSDEFPKGPYPDGGGDSDTPCHCDSCHIFLENPLTSEGFSYIIEKIKNFISSDCKMGNIDVMSEWADFYEIKVSDLLNESGK